MNSISIEFSSAVDETTVAQIKNRALKTLKLQTEIVRSFLNGPGCRSTSSARGSTGCITLHCERKCFHTIPASFLRPIQSGVCVL